MFVIEKACNFHSALSFYNCIDGYDLYGFTAVQEAVFSYAVTRFNEVVATAAFSDCVFASCTKKKLIFSS